MGFVLFYDACVIDNELWFSNNNYNALMKLDLSSNMIVKVGVFPEISPCAKKSHRRIIVNGDSLIFMPFNCGFISFFNRKTGVFRSVELPCKGVTYADGCLIDDALWLFPFAKNGNILKYDLKSSTFEQMSDLTKSFCDLCNTSQLFSVRAIALYGDRIFAVPYGSRYICEIDIKSSQVKILYEFSSSVHLYGITESLDSKFLIWTMNGLKIYSWDICTKPRFLYEGIEEHFMGFENPISDICVCDRNNMILLPGKTDKILLLNNGDNTIKNLAYPKGATRISPYLLFTGFARINEGVILFPGSINKILKIDIGSFGITEIEVLSNETMEDYEKKMNVMYVQNKLFDGELEEYFGKNTLELFLNEVIMGDSLTVKKNTCKSGEDIFSHALGILV